MKSIKLIILFLILTTGLLAQSSTLSKFYDSYNVYRVQNSLSVLVIDTMLEKASTQHSLYLALLNFDPNVDSFLISHYEDRKVVNIKELYSPKDRILDYDTLKRYHISENITAIYNGCFTADEILQEWIKSPLHNKNLLNYKNKRMGLGIIIFEKNGKPCTYATLLMTD